MELAPKRIKKAKRTVQRAEPGSLNVINNEVNCNEDHIDFPVALDLDNIFDIDPMNLSIEPLDSPSTQNTPTINKPGLVGLQMDVNQSENVMIDNQTDVNNDHPQERLDDVPDRILPGTPSVNPPDIPGLQMKVNENEEIQIDNNQIAANNDDPQERHKSIDGSTALVSHEDLASSQKAGSTHDMFQCQCKPCTIRVSFWEFGHALIAHINPKSTEDKKKKGQWVTPAAEFFERFYGHLIRLNDTKGFVRWNPATRTNTHFDKTAFTAYVGQVLFDCFNTTDKNQSEGAKHEIGKGAKKVVDIIFGRLRWREAEDAKPPVDNSHLIAFRNGLVYDRKVGEYRERTDEDGDIEAFDYDLVEWDPEKYPKQRYLWDAFCKMWPDSSDRFFGLTNLSTILGSRRGLRELLILYGPSSNGKSLVGRLMKLMTCYRFLGATASSLQSKPGNGNKPSDIHWKMGQKSTLITWFSEGDEKDLYSGSAVKMAVGGDSAYLRRAYGKNEELTITGLVVLATNHLPYFDCGLYDNDHRDITDKLVVIPCKSKFVSAHEHEDPSQHVYYKDGELDRLINNEDRDLASAMMALMVSLHHDHLQTEEYPLLSKPASVISATADLVTRVHPYRTFVKEMCVIEEGAKMRQCMAMACLQNWTKQHPVWRKCSPRTQDFKAFLLHAYPAVSFGTNRRIDGVQTTGFYGIRLKEEEGDKHGGRDKFLLSDIDILSKAIEE
ncbi:uncharacterized protein EV422DRAFT_565447 [Fimicolochytrium jonesii]|uniref:uncharacterized protein n=1 Tax=Fimicolochytrium jonesii TaxID=1396493 RepID=UPI0022FE4717|nr:uncharacterized protein EV422DRAFT_565447 [Fimicolochytrium jonesii]KAI8823501.1 hypothetical protein EV422DRAFT_565447 [Fimicolochytrium jonesii]